MARANPLWKTWTAESEVLIIFTGPHGYISPGWYQQQVTVPTWNYSAVHVYGRPRIISDSSALQALVMQRVQMYEEKEGATWNQSLIASIIENELKAIVGFEIRIERIEGKFKFNQNRSTADQHGVIQVLEGGACPFKKAAGRFMKSIVPSLEKNERWVGLPAPHAVQRMAASICDFIFEENIAQHIIKSASSTLTCTISFNGDAVASLTIIRTLRHSSLLCFPFAFFIKKFHQQKS